MKPRRWKPRAPERRYCKCGCGVWWYSPPAPGFRKFLNRAHVSRMQHLIGRHGEPRACVRCGAEYLVLSRPGRPVEYCSAECRRLAHNEQQKVSRGLKE